MIRELSGDGSTGVWLQLVSVDQDIMVTLLAVELAIEFHSTTS